MMQEQAGHPPKRKSPTGGETGRAYKSSTGRNYTPIGFVQIRQMVAGQWHRVHVGCGIVLVTQSHRHKTPCPGCGGRDRFRVCDDYDITGRWLCSGGGSFQHGDGFALLGHVFGWSPSEQLAAVKRVMGIDESMTPAKRKELAEQAAAYQSAMHARVRAMDERRRLDAGTKGLTLELDDAIDYRRRGERALKLALAPSDDERGIAGRLVSHLSEAYGLEVAR